MKKIGIFGGSFNPPGVHHRIVAENLLSLNCVDSLMVIPCGTRRDKIFPNSSDRRNMVMLAFADLPGCIVNTFNIDLDLFTSNLKYEMMFRCLGEIWHVVGSDQVINGRNHVSLIHTHWENGNWVFDNLKFIVVERPGYPVIQSDLPPHRLVLQLLAEGSSREIRDAICTSGYSDLLSREVLVYISQKKLYGIKT